MLPPLSPTTRHLMTSGQQTGDDSKDPTTSSPLTDFPPEPLVRRLILSYLVRNCYTETALAYTPQNHPDCLKPNDLDDISKRKEMMRRIGEGDISGGVNMAERLLEMPLKDVDCDLWFDCCLQEFAECVRSRDMTITLKVLQTKVADVARDNEKKIEKLLQYVALLLNKFPEKGPSGMLLEKGRRQVLSERLNGVVVGKVRGGGEKGELEMLLRQTMLLREVEDAGGSLEKKCGLTIDDLLKDKEEEDD